jgi:hypothetical protein
MIIFDRFLFCINLKTFGKFFGWVGTMTAIMIAYAMFLVASAKSANVNAIKERYFGKDFSTEG